MFFCIVQWTGRFCATLFILISTWRTRPPKLCHRCTPSLGDRLEMTLAEKSFGIHFTSILVLPCQLMWYWLLIVSTSSSYKFFRMPRPYA
jgi:hypothetical protein